MAQGRHMFWKAEGATDPKLEASEDTAGDGLADFLVGSQAHGRP